MVFEDFTKEELIQFLRNSFYFDHQNLIRELCTQRYRTKAELALKRMDILCEMMQKEKNQIELLKLNKEYEQANKDFDKIQKWYEKVRGE